MVSAPQVQSSVNHPGTPGSERKGDTNQPEIRERVDKPSPCRSDLS
jgi:hypothetical protein